jgi:hypothetical protein
MAEKEKWNYGDPTIEETQRIRKRDRLRALFRPNSRPLPSQTYHVVTSSTITHVEVCIPESGDRQRTKDRYFECLKELHQAMKDREGAWGCFEIPDLCGEPEDFNDSQFKDKINNVLDAQKNRIRDMTAWGKCRHTMQCVFTAMRPFAKNFVTIMKEGSQVNCG